MEGVGSTEPKQEVALEITVKADAGTQVIAQTFVRDSVQSTTDVATAPGPTQEPQGPQSGARHEANSDSADSGSAHGTRSVLWSFDGTTWSANGTPPSCVEPIVFRTPVDLELVT